MKGILDSLYMIAGFFPSLKLFQNKLKKKNLYLSESLLVTFSHLQVMLVLLDDFQSILIWKCNLTDHSLALVLTVMS